MSGYFLLHLELKGVEAISEVHWSFLSKLREWFWNFEGSFHYISCHSFSIDFLPHLSTKSWINLKVSSNKQKLHLQTSKESKGPKFWTLPTKTSATWNNLLASWHGRSCCFRACLMPCWRQKSAPQRLRPVLWSSVVIQVRWRNWEIRRLVVKVVEFDSFWFQMVAQFVASASYMMSTVCVFFFSGSFQGIPFGEFLRSY